MSGLGRGEGEGMGGSYIYKHRWAKDQIRKFLLMSVLAIEIQYPHLYCKRGSLRIYRQVCADTVLALQPSASDLPRYLCSPFYSQLNGELYISRFY